MLLLVLTVAALVALASPAWAHVEIEPAEAVAGATESLTFSVAYEGSATTGLVVQLPEGASVSEVPAKAGWTSAVDEAEHTVSWSGGSAAADDTFSVVVVLPTTPGEVLFPTIQQTVEGEVAWIGEEEGEDHGSNPAPRLTLVADPERDDVHDRGLHHHDRGDDDDRRAPRHHAGGRASATTAPRRRRRG